MFISLAKSDLGRKLIQAGMHDVSVITYLYSFPPGTPKDRVQLFRWAFWETVKDTEFLAEAKKANLDVDPVAGEDLEKVVNGFFLLDTAVVNKLREILK